MKFSTISSLSTLALTSASAHPSECKRGASNITDSGEWIAGGPDDFRGPCPMLNTLANHGFLPRDGRNITLNNAVYALTTALNFNESVAVSMWSHGVKSNPAGANSSSFTLDDLNKHNLLEHDASMSRSDAFFGNNHVFSSTVFATTTAFWTADILTAPMLARGTLNRQIQSAAFNPTYVFNATTNGITLGEVAAFVLVFGDIPAVTVRKDFMTSFFENERLPTELGWVKQAEIITLEQVRSMTGSIKNGTSTVTPSDAELAAAAAAGSNVTARAFMGGMHSGELA